ncbi:MAG: DNA-binding domain-containing protein [Pseudomonadota bacterium]|nr:DNA-binding domain-containing protein [Pseudomonadota bacterium]
MTLAEKQAAFMRSILDEDAALPDGWGHSQTLGMNVYRGNYRSAAMGALESSFDRTAAYMGEDAFRQAAINHVIANPSSHWTIDATGSGFDETCASLFPDNPEVAELAWLEWAMLDIGGAADVTPLSPEDFGDASAGFGDQDWMRLAITFQPRSACRSVANDLSDMWQALSQDDAAVEAKRFEAPQGCIVWREGERPTFQIVQSDHARGFSAIQAGARYGELIALLAGEEPTPEAIQRAAQSAGAMLGQWLGDGLITAIEA